MGFFGKNRVPTCVGISELYVVMRTFWYQSAQGS